MIVLQACPVPHRGMTSRSAIAITWSRMICRWAHCWARAPLARSTEPSGMVHLWLSRCVVHLCRSNQPVNWMVMLHHAGTAAFMASCQIPLIRQSRPIHEVMLVA